MDILRQRIHPDIHKDIARPYSHCLSIHLFLWRQVQLVKPVKQDQLVIQVIQDLLAQDLVVQQDILV